MKNYYKFNMKAKKVYEFKRTRKQGLSKQTEIGLNYYTVLETKKWFEEYAPDSKYKIENNLFYITNFLYLVDSPAKSIPDNIKEVNGTVNLYNSSIEKLPDNFIVNADIILADTLIKELPKNLYCEKLDLHSNKTIEYLPDDIKIRYSLNAVHSVLKEIPEHINLLLVLDLDDSQVEKLPSKLKINSLNNMPAYCSLVNTKITSLPEFFHTRELHISKNNIKDIISNYPEELQKYFLRKEHSIYYKKGKYDIKLEYIYYR